MQTCEMTTINEMRKVPPKGNQHAQGSNLGRAASAASCSVTIGYVHKEAEERYAHPRDLERVHAD